MQLTHNGFVWVADFPFNIEVKDRVKSIGFKWDARAKKWWTGSLVAALSLALSFPIPSYQFDGLFKVSTSEWKKAGFRPKKGAKPVKVEYDKNRNGFRIERHFWRYSDVVRIASRPSRQATKSIDESLGAPAGMP